MEKFEWLVLQMRMAQKRYFQTKTLADLHRTTELEKEVDKLLDNKLNPVII